MAGTLAEGRLVFEPIPPARLQQIRAAGVDEAGNRLTVQVDTDVNCSTQLRNTAHVQGWSPASFDVAVDCGTPLGPHK